MDKLKPCPFCGSDEVGCWMSSQTFPNGKNPHWVCCDNCEATTGQYCTVDEAIEAWNMRADTKEIDFDYEAEDGQ